MMRLRNRVLRPVYLSIALVAAFSFVISMSPAAEAVPLTNSTLKWTSQTPSGNATWQSVAWSPELNRLVAVAASVTFPTGTVQRIMTSSDAKSWAPQSAPGSRAVFSSITWSPSRNLFVAVYCADAIASTCPATTTTSQVITSPDGITWTTRTNPDMTATWQSVTWSPEANLFVAVADSGTTRVMTSPDGVTWTGRTAAEANAWESVTWSSQLGLFVAVASSGTNRVMTSPDGITWTPRMAAAVNAWASVAWSPGMDMFVALSQDGANRVMISSDGITWASQPAATVNAWKSAVWVPEKQAFVAVANGGISTTRVMTGAMATAGTDDATAVTPRTATLNGNYQDSFPGASVFFRYRVAGSSDPYTETTPVSVTSSGAFTANASSLLPYTTYEYKAVVQWPVEDGTRTLEGGQKTFTTQRADDDNDGVYNDIEDAAPNSGDVNEDSIADSMQPFVASFVDGVTGNYTTLEIDAACQIDHVAGVAESALAVQDAYFEYPYGLIDFKADCTTPGFQATVAAYFFGAQGDLVARKYHPNDGTYATVDSAVLQQVTIGGEDAGRVSYQIADGGSLDTDGIVDGFISDPIGLAQNVPVSTPVSPAPETPEDVHDLASTGQSFVPVILGTLGLIVIGIAVGGRILRSITK